MDSDIYHKGQRLVDAGRIHLREETDRAAYFVVDGDTGTHHVRLMRDNTFNCTCLWGTLHGAVYGSLCSHVVGAILHQAQPEARVQEATPR